MASDKLTAKQNAFAEDIGNFKYDYDWLAYEANYDCKKMSKNAIYVETCRLLQNPKIALRIKEIREQTVKRNHVTVDEVLNELANWIRFDPLSIVDPDDDSIKRLADMPKEARMSLAEIHVQELFEMLPNESGSGKVRTKIGELKKIKFYDKTKVADMFMKKFGEYLPDKDGLSSSLEAIRDIIEGLKK